MNNAKFKIKYLSIHDFKAALRKDLYCMFFFHPVQVKKRYVVD